MSLLVDVLLLLVVLMVLGSELLGSELAVLVVLGSELDVPVLDVPVLDVPVVEVPVVDVTVDVPVLDGTESPLGTTSISSGSLPRVTEMLPVLLALWMDDVPVTGSNTSISDAADPRFTVTECWLPLSSHRPIQNEPSDFSIRIELSPDCVPDRL